MDLHEDEGYDDDEELDEGEMMKALELNRQLKEMMMRQMQEEQEEPTAKQRVRPRPKPHGAARRGDEPITSVAPSLPVGPSRRPKNNYTLTDDEMGRISRANNHLLQRMVDIHKSGVNRKGGGFSFNENYFDGGSTRHVSSNSINRRKNGDKISRENEQLARRLNAVRSSVPAHGATMRGGGGGGGIRSSGYTTRGGGVGPLARKNELAARAPKPTRLEQPEMQF